MESVVIPFACFIQGLNVQPSTLRRFLFVNNQNIDEYINATFIAQEHGKRAQHWLSVNKTKVLLEEVSKALNIQPDALVIVKAGGNDGGTWIHPALKNVFEIWCKSKTSIAIPELYVVLFNTGVLKVGRSNKGFNRVKSHISQAQCFGVKTLQFFIEKNPTITEEDLIEFCNQNGTLHHGSEYFTNLDYVKVVNFLKRKIERKVLRLVRSNNE